MKHQRRDGSINILDNHYGYVPPQSRDAEMAVLGAILLETKAFDRVCTVLRPEQFYVEAHQRVFRAVTELSLGQQPIDIITVKERLQEKGELDVVGGMFYLMKLTNDIVSSANIEAHARVIADRYIKRRLIEIGSEMQAKGYAEEDLDVSDIAGDAVTQISQVVSTQSTNLSDISTLLVKEASDLEKRSAADSHLVGVDTGYRVLNRLTYGWQPDDLVIVAARPSVGKTAYALNIALNACEAGTATAIFSLEMSAQKLVQRALAIRSGIDLENIITGKLEEYEKKKLYTNGISVLANYKLHIDDTPAISLMTLRGLIKKLVDENGVRLVVIDYLQLMSGNREKNSNREQEIASISRGLKAIAKELHITIIALSQLSRGIETRGSKEPTLADLRESGAIEQDADMVIFLWREDYQQAEGTGDPMLQGKAMGKIAKNRNGKIDYIPLSFEGKTQRWTEDIGVQRIQSPAPPPGLMPILKTENARLFIDSEVERPEPEVTTYGSVDEIEGDLPF